MSKYSSAFKQEVVAYDSDGEHGYRAVGLHFGLDYSMVRRWVASHAAHGVAGLSRKHSRDWCDWIADKEAPKNPDGAFIKLAKKWYEKRQGNFCTRIIISVDTILGQVYASA